MTPAKLQEVLKDAISHKEQLLVVGQPGIGKTDIIKAVCDNIGADLVISHPAVADPTDYKGLPFKVDETHASFMPFGDLWKLINATSLTVYFMDDMGQSSEAVQKALMQLTHGRRLNGHILPDCVTFVGATNDVGQRAGVSGLIEPVKSRFIIVHLETSIDDWTIWAVQNGMPPELIAFLRTNVNLLSAFEPTKAISNSPCPRNWAAVGRYLARGVKNFELFSGSVGKGAATELMAFLEMATEAPSIDAILMSPTTAPIPDKPAIRYLVASGLSARMKKENIKRAFQYLERLPQAFRVLAIRDATKRDKGLHQTEEVIYWYTGEGQEVGF